MTITGTNDVGVISGSSAANLTEDNNSVLTVSGVLTINDADIGQAVFVEQLNASGLSLIHI